MEVKNDHKLKVGISVGIVITLLIIPIVLYFIGDLGTAGGSYIPMKWVIIAFPKIGIPLFFSVYIFILYSKQDRHFFMDAKHLFAWQFLLLVIGKIFDLYFVYLGEGSMNNVSGPEFLPLLQIRWVVYVLNVLPVFAFFVHIYSQVWTLKLKEKSIFLDQNATPDDVRDFKGKFEKIIDISYLVISLIIVALAPDYTFLRAFGMVLILPMVIMALVTFNDLRKHQRLPQLNSTIMLFGYIIYAISIFSRIFIADIEYTYITEAIEAIAYYFMGISFVIRPKYGRIPRKEEVTMAVA